MYNVYSCNRKKKGTRIDKNGEEITKLQKIYLTFYNFLIAQDIWQAHYQILSIILLKQFINLNVNTDTDQNVKFVELHTKYAAVFLDTQIL